MPVWISIDRILCEQPDGNGYVAQQMSAMAGLRQAARTARAKLAAHQRVPGNQRSAALQPGTAAATRDSCGGSCGRQLDAEPQGLL